MARWRSLALLLAFALALLSPSVAAFSSTTRDLLIAYDVAATPVVVGSGAVTLSGSITGAFLLGGVTRTALADIESLIVIDGADQFDVHGATLEVSSGALLWRFTAGVIELDVAAPYALGLALPQAPVPSEDGATSAGFLLVGEAISGTAAWRGGPVELVPIDAVVTMRDASSQPVPGWDGRRVNADLANADAVDARTVAFQAEGAFQARVGAAIVAGATGSGADVALSVSRADEDRFAQTVDLLARTAANASGEAPGYAGQDRPLAILGRVSGILNGALLLVPGDGTSAVAEPREAHWGLDDFEVGTFNIARGDDLRVAWSEGEMRLEGEPTVALGREGFAVEPPVAVGIFPAVSLVLWALALGAIVWWIVKRPPQGAPIVGARFASFGIYVIVLLGALYLWDKSFTATFGAGVLSSIRDNGISPETLPEIGALAVLELIPWSIAGFLFALPVRIALGIALRYLGRGKSYKGIATAGGLVSLMILGPIYALWCFNLIWAQAGRALAGG